MKAPFKAGAIAAAMALTATAASAEVYIKYENIPGDVVIGGYEGGDWFVADSFSFGVEREMKESGEKGGTEDINIGVGELQDCTISKSMDVSSPELAKLALSGRSLGGVEVCFAETGAGPTQCYLKFKLERAFVKSWSTTGDGDDRPTEEVAFYYNKIAFQYARTEDGKGFDSEPISWNNKRKKPCPECERSLAE